MILSCLVLYDDFVMFSFILTIFVVRHTSKCIDCKVFCDSVIFIDYLLDCLKYVVSHSFLLYLDDIYTCLGQVVNG